jgi:putative two-component system response regulator
MTTIDHAGTHIVIVDDQELNLHLLERMLQKNGYTRVSTYQDPRRFISEVAFIKPDLILLDLHMPHLNGFEVLQRLPLIVPDAPYLPVIVLTADITADAKRQALEYGARDFLTKPFDTVEVLLRIKNLLELGMLYRELRLHNVRLEEKVHERTKALESAQIEILERLARAAEFRDDDTGQHTERVGLWAAAVAEALGLPDEDIELLRRAAPLHDVGKIGIPDSILLKPGRLTADEFETVKTHTLIGAGILGGSRFPLLQVAAEIALSHHERWDGSGYPRGLAGESIPLVGRIVAIADVFDALIHERPYKAAWPVADALAEIERQSGRQFDPHVVAAFRDAYSTLHHVAAPRPAPLEMHLRP